MKTTQNLRNTRSKLCNKPLLSVLLVYCIKNKLIAKDDSLALQFHAKEQNVYDHIFNSIQQICAEKINLKRDDFYLWCDLTNNYLSSLANNRIECFSLKDWKNIMRQMDDFLANLVEYRQDSPRWEGILSKLEKSQIFPALRSFTLQETSV